MSILEKLKKLQNEFQGGAGGCLIVLLAAVVYANSFPGAFIQDDIHIVKYNPLMADLDLSRIFTSDYWLGVEQSGLYRPLTILSLALNRQLLGEAAWGFHLVNVFLHAGVGILLWKTLQRWGVTAKCSLLAAALFVVHPIHSEVVNQVVGRSELLVAAFVLLALNTAWRDDTAAHCWTLIAFAAALLSKEHAVVLLGLLPLLDAYRAGGWTFWWHRWRLYAGLLLVFVLWLSLRNFLVTGVGVKSVYSMTAVPLAYLPWGSRVLTALCYQWFYLGKLLVPWKLQTVYSQADLPPIIESFFSAAGLGVVLSVGAGAALIIMGWRRRQPCALYAALYAVSFAPTANIFLPIGVTFAERLTYFPSLWFCAAVSIMATQTKWPDMLQRMVLPLCCCFLFIYAAVLIDRNRDYASELLLWSREVRINANDYLGWQSYAEVLASGHRYEEAERAYRHLLALRPEFQGGLRSYIAFLLRQQRYRDALVPAEEVLQRSTDQQDVAGMAYDLTNLGRIHIELGQFEQALAFLQQTDEKQVQEDDYYLALLGRAQEGLGNYAEAVAAYRQMREPPKDLNIPLHYGLSLMQIGRLAEAREQLDLASRTNPSPEAWNLLGTVQARLGSLALAEAAFAQAVNLAPDKTHYRENLERVRQLRGAETGTVR